MATNWHRRLRDRAGVASVILAVFLSAVVLVLAVALTAYNQLAAARQAVTATATGALRSAVPAGFVTETVVTSTSQQAHGLLVDPAAYDVAVGQALPSFWSGAQVQLCTTTPQGSPVTCTPGNSFLVTLPTATAQDLHIAGPLVVANIQLVTRRPYKVTHFGHTTTLAQPAVAADVTYPVDISMSGLHFTVWAKQAITNGLYADQGGSTGGSARYLAFGTTPNQGSGGNSQTSPTMCWSWPNVSNQGCSTRPSWCPTNAVSCTLNPQTLMVSYKLPGSMYSSFLSLTPTEIGTLPWAAPPSNACWTGGTRMNTGSGSQVTYSLNGTPGSSSCQNQNGGQITPSYPGQSTTSLPSWATEVVTTTAITSYQPGVYNVNARTCFVGTLPNSSGGTTQASYCPTSLRCARVGGGWRCA